MVDAVDDVLLSQALDGFADHGFMAVLDHPNELHSPETLELRFELGKAELDGVEIGLVRNVVDRLEAEPAHLSLGLLRGVSAQIIHEDADLIVLVGLPELLQILLEPGYVDRQLKNLVVLLTLFLRYCRQQGQSGFIKPGHVNRHVLLWQAVLSQRDCLSRHHSLVQVHHAVTLLLHPNQLPPHSGDLLPQLVLVHVLGFLRPPDRSLLDFVLSVDLAEQRRVHVRRGELSKEQLASFLQ